MDQPSRRASIWQFVPPYGRWRLTIQGQTLRDAGHHQFNSLAGWLKHHNLFASQQHSFDCGSVKRI
jgi:hypothetical protein